MPFFLLLLLPLTATNSQHHKFSIGGPEFCDQTSECLAKVRRMAQESNRFWFGDQWRFNCAAGQHQQGRGGGDGRRSRAGTGDGGAASALDCLNPPELAPFASLGSRLFRVHTFTPAYLANLRVFPRMHFQPRSGFYRACAHNYEVVVSEEERLFGLAGHPLAQPVPAFQAQQTPDLSWPELHANHSLLILMLDVGGGRLSYMAIDFPRDTKVLAEFLPLDNFRLLQPTPLAVLIFELPKAKTIRQSLLEAIEAKWTTPKAARRENFDFSQFMVEHRLEKGLIGLNWVLIDADPFAIEKQRLQGMPDNCHALVLQKLHQDRRWHFVQTFPLSAELDSSLSVSLAQPKLNVQVCCKSQSIEQEQLFLDPLGDLQVPTAALRQGPPTVTSLRPMESGGETAAYQRASRHYIVFRDERYSLLLVDPERRYLHWLIVDIPAEGLASDNFDEAAVVANYLAPVPQLPSAHCHFPVFMLFRQPRAEPMAEFFGRDHPLRQSQCQQGHCANRANFNVEQFKALHRLQLSALNWAKVCFDLFEASHQISSLRQRSSELVHQGNGNDGRAKAGSKRSGGRAVSYLQTTDRAERDRQIGAICAQFPDHNQTEHRQCIVQTSAGASSMIRLGTNFAGFCYFLTTLLLSILGSSSRRTLINGGCCWLL